MSLFDIKFRDGTWAVSIAATAEEAIWNVCRDSAEERADIVAVECIPDSVGGNMTYDKAIEVFTHGSADVDEVLEANRMAFDAMKRLLPMKPRKRTMFYPLCPQCGHTIDQADGKPRHCRWCGQAFLWEEG